MKKIMLTIAAAVCMLFASFCLCACDLGGGSDPLSQFTGVTLESKEFTYDAKPHSLALSGDVPTDTTVKFTDNEKTDAGTYTVTAELSKSGYESKTLTATLKINKAEFDGVTLEDKSFLYFGKPCSLAVEGNMPSGTEITYTNNDKTEVGVYEVIATLTNPNYITKTLTAKLTITAKTDFALSVVTALLNKPDPWNFLPRAFYPENMAHAVLPVNGIDRFATDVRVSEISDRFTGKQFRVLYEGLSDAETVLGKIDSVFAVGTTIADAYQTYINEDPDGYKVFSGEVAGFNIKIELNDDEYTMLVGNSAVNIELGYNDSSKTRTGRLQLTSGIAVKYVSDDDSFKLAVSSAISGVGNLKQIEFARDGSAVAGYLREFTGTEAKNLKTSGVIAIDDKTLKVMSDKRESDDLVIDGYEEVYSCTTGKMIGGRVQETVKVVDYDTIWLNLGRVTGFDSVRMAAEANGLNANTVYVNGSSNAFATKKVNPLIPTSSRRFDIEMKEVWYITKSETDGKVAYAAVKTEIPMLFVQTKQTDSFTADVKEKNGYIDAKLPVSDMTAVNADYDALKGLFAAIKDQVGYNDIKSFIGDKNEFFDTAA